MTAPDSTPEPLDFHGIKVYAIPCDDYDALLALLREALLRLTRLSNEAGGSMALAGVREAIGNTNLAALELRVDEARVFLDAVLPKELNDEST